MIELLVVLGITGLILASVVSSRPRTVAARVESTARSIAVTLQLAKSRAMATASEVVIVVDPSKGEYGRLNAMKKVPEGMGVAVTVAEPERLGDRGGLRFFPDGRSSGGDILLALEGRTKRISVNWLTGEPSISR